MNKASLNESLWIHSWVYIVSGVNGLIVDAEIHIQIEYDTW